MTVPSEETRYRIPDGELRGWVERLADQLCLTVGGNFDHLIQMDVTDDTLEKLQVVVNFVLDNARRAAEARREADRLVSENVSLLSDLGNLREIGNYTLEELLGEGGMGEVWKGRHRMLARPVAVKLIKRRQLGDGGTIAANRLLVRFQREAKSTAALRSPHTVAVYDFGLHEETFYYVMELLDGLDLRTLVEYHGPQPVERVLYLIRQACHSLQEAHSVGLIHRDVKPANLFVCRHGIDFDFLKVLDFGLVKDVHSRAETLVAQDVGICGTPGFIAPEQILDQRKADARADLYALGCTAYWLLSGRQVFEGKTTMLVLSHHMSASPPPLSEVARTSIPEPVGQLVMSCLEKDPAARPQDAAEIIERIDEIGLAEEWLPSRREGWWTNRKKMDTVPAISFRDIPTLDS